MYKYMRYKGKQWAMVIEMERTTFTIQEDSKN